MDSAKSEMNRRQIGLLPDAMTRYDATLAAIPFAFVLGVALDVILSTPSWVPLSVSATMALAVLVDGLFIHPPQRRGRSSF